MVFQQQHFGLRDKALPLGRRHDGFFQPIEERVADLLLDFLNLHAEGWLRHVTLFSGFSKMLMLVNGDNVLKLR